MLAEIVISLLVSLDVILFVRGIAHAWPFKVVDASTLNHFMKNAPLDRGENARNRPGDLAMAPVSDGTGVSESPRNMLALPKSAFTLAFPGSPNH
jgi:hypothetical protein